MRAMHVIQARTRGASAITVSAVLGAAVVGTVFVGLGLAVTWLALTTPIVFEISRLGQGRVGSLAGALVWGLAFLIPGLLVVFGVSQLVGAVEHWLALVPARARPVASLAQQLPDEYCVVEGARLPDGRIVPEVVVGPSGVLLVEEIPPAEATRHRGSYWEVRLASGRWIPIENPLERAARDASRLKNWLANEEEDASPRMYVAVVTNGQTDVDRTSDVAVLTRDQIPSFIGAMPPLRYMTPEVRSRITERLRSTL